METSSRIFVRNLPPRFSEDEFRKVFSKYPITDIKLFENRRFGYVGYKSPEEAASAVKYFNKSFIRLSKINVEIARPIADQSLPKSRRDQRHDNAVDESIRHVPSTDSTLKRKRPEAEVDQDPKLQEFLTVMQAPSKNKSWREQDALLQQGGVAVAQPTEDVVPAGESDDEYQVIAKKPKTSTDDVRAASGIQQTKHLPVRPVDTRDTPALVAEPTDGPAQPAKTQGGPLTDDDWLRSRTNRVLDLEDDEGGIALPKEHVVQSQDDKPVRQDPDPGPGLDESEQPPHHEQEQKEETESVEDQIRKTRRLYLRNLPYDVSEEDLRNHFSKIGPIEEVHVPMTTSTGAAKGFAFILFDDPEHAVTAFQQNDGTIFQGRLLHILPAASKRVAIDDFELSKLPLKKKKELTRKAEAARSTFNWNSLYLNADSVMSAVASRLGISKSELLDPTSSDAAVKQAHAETHVISEMKAYFARHGVDLEAFKRSSKGDVAILVKNIPHGTTSDEVRKLFEEHGTLKHFLMPPSGMTAIVEFANAAQAQTAFKALAYRKLGGAILYLEKAPKNLFKEGFQVPVESPAPVAQQAAGKLSAADLLNDAPEQHALETTTLFVRNLNFSTTTQRLKEVFSPLDGFMSARVKTKIDPKRGVLSMGFGFLEFKSAAAAAAALKAMDGYNLDGHQLQLRASHKGADAAEERRKEDAAKKAAGTKLSVKNLPFEATKKDLRALFAPYGQLRSVRVAKKFDSTSRGFGFVDFTTTREASNALDALKHTHLLGRRLVIAFAETDPDDPEQELEKMQQKVGAQANKVALQRLTGGGRKRFNIAGNDDLDEA